MVEFRKFGGLILYKINGNDITDFYGRHLYFFDGDYIRKWDSRMIEYKFDGNYIRDFYGRILYSFDGEYFRDFYGKILYVFRNNNIAPFASINQYTISSGATRREVATLITLFVVDQD